MRTDAAVRRKRDLKWSEDNREVGDRHVEEPVHGVRSDLQLQEEALVPVRQRDGDTKSTQRSACPFLHGVASVAWDSSSYNHSFHDPKSNLG